VTNLLYMCWGRHFLLPEVYEIWTVFQELAVLLCSVNGSRLKVETEPCPEMSCTSDNGQCLL
jgi:hypothetical protein